MYFFSRQDQSGFVYCVRLDKVEHGDFLKCATCEYFRGSYQGQGRECEVGDDDQVTYIEEPFSYMEGKMNTSKGGA